MKEKVLIGIAILIFVVTVVGMRMFGMAYDFILTAVSTSILLAIPSKKVNKKLRWLKWISILGLWLLYTMFMDGTMMVN